jgi:hypothetical protein
MSTLLTSLLAWIKGLALKLLTRLSEWGHPTNPSGNNMSQR